MVVALVSWGIAFFEYMLQVPANRIGSTALSLPQLKIIQEVITLSVFVPFVLFYKAAAQMGLPLGGPLHVRRRVLCLQEVALHAALPQGSTSQRSETYCLIHTQ